MKEVRIFCKSWIDAMSLVHQLVGDDFSFRYNANTGEVIIDVLDDYAVTDVEDRLRSYDLKHEYTIKVFDKRD